MRASDSAPAGLAGNLVVRNVYVKILQLGYELEVALATALLQAFEPVLQRTRTGLEPQHDHVHATGGPLARQLNAWNEFHLVRVGCCGSLEYAVEIVVVGESHRLKAGGFGRGNDLSRAI